MENSQEANISQDSSAGHQRDNDVNLLEEIADSYFIQEEEEQLRADGKLKLEYYFDSFDVINMVQGAMTYDTGLKFDKDALKRDERKNSVYALAFQGLFENIRMLPPHQVEFESKLDKSDVFFKVPKNKDRFLDVCQEVLFSLGLESPGTSKKIDFSKIDEHIKQLVDKGGDIFKANYLLREYTWARRLKYLVEEKILIIGNVDTHDITRIENSELFREIKTGFDIVRPNYPTNNYYDALAFFDLQQKLNDYVDKPSSNPLPVFYASSPVVREAVKIIRADHPELFAYRQENKLIPIVRDSLFFVLEAVFSVGDNTQDFFKGLRDAQGQIRTLVKKEYEKYYTGDIVKNLEYSRKQFEEKVREIINVKFVQEIWIKHKAYQKLIDELKAAYTLDVEQLPLLRARIRQTLKSVLEKARIDLKHSQKLGAIIEAFQSVSADIKKSIGHSPSSDVFRDFALMKFGLDSEKLPLLQDRISGLMTSDNEEESFPPAIYDVISSLTISPDNEEKAKQFLSALTVTWLLDKHKLIEALCSDLRKEDMKKRYETALIYGASHIALRRNRAGIKRTQEIIDCILSQVIRNYKVWLGVGYLYFQMWESKTSLKPDLPEINLEVWERQRKSREFERFVQKGAIKYAKKAYDFLARKKEEEDEAEQFNLKNFLYALNNVIYYTTKCGSEEEFSALEDLVEELHRYDRMVEWQGRFFDTLGWYYLRKYYRSHNETLRKGFLEKAETNYRLALSRIASPRDQSLYQHLHRAILKAQEKEADGNKAKGRI